MDCSEKTVWQMLPEPLQKYLSLREADRERVLKRKFDEIADAKKQLLRRSPPMALLKSTPLKILSLKDRIDLVWQECENKVFISERL